MYTTPSLRPLLTIILTLSLLLTPTSGRQPSTSFCKCICFTNSTIIPLNSSPSTTSSRSLPVMAPRQDDDDDNAADTTTGAAQQKRLTCNDCTRAFCLDYNLPICKGAKEEDVFTTCFQRDSLKDETIVLLFIVMTTGLLGWALVKPLVDRLRDTDAVQRYAPVVGGGGGSLDLPRVGLGLNRSGRGRGGGGLPAFRDQGGAPSGHRTQDSGDSESFARQGGLNS